jgi:bifunctional enzyme CysN/CysC
LGGGLISLAPSGRYRPTVIWLTGLPCSGKSTLAELVAEWLTARGERVTVLDGDLLRRSTSSDLGFSPDDRLEQARRAAMLAQAALEESAVVIVALVSPTVAARDLARLALGSAFQEVFVDAPVAVCESRDVKGMYAKARAGEIASFTGVSAPYDAPVRPDLHLDTGMRTPHESLSSLLDLLDGRLVDPSAASTRSPAS